MSFVYLLFLLVFVLIMIIYFFLRFGPKRCPRCGKRTWGTPGLPIGVRRMYFVCKRCNYRFTGHMRLPMWHHWSHVVICFSRDARFYKVGGSQNLRNRPNDPVLKTPINGWFFLRAGSTVFEKESPWSGDPRKKDWCSSRSIRRAGWRKSGSPPKVTVRTTPSWKRP